MNVKPAELGLTPEIKNTSFVKSTLISFLVYDCDEILLEKYLSSLCQQNKIENFEIIVCEDALSDGYWDLACRYADEYKGVITLFRHRISMGNAENKRRGQLLCKGKYCVDLSDGEPLNVEAVVEKLERLESSAHYEKGNISKLKNNKFFPSFNFNSPKTFMPSKKDEPIVSICIYNYNYGRFLRQCLESVFTQTYSNIEVCFSDNASDDESWLIAQEYAQKYPNKMSLIRNRKNFGAHVNLWNCMLNVSGSYLLKLCSDDVLKPDFISRAMSALENHPDAAFVMTHREIINSNNDVTSEPPFYDCSCYISGAEQAAVYMMSSVNPSVSQVFYNVAMLEGKRMAGDLNDRWFGDRMMDFHICCEFPIIYLKDALVCNRVHTASDSASLDGNLLQCLGEYVLVHQLADIANTYPGMEKASDRLPDALEKLGRLCLRYCLRGLINGDDELASRYYHLAIAIFPKIQQDTLYKKLSGYWESESNIREKVLDKLIVEFNDAVTRKHSYPAPSGSILLQKSV